MDSGGSMQFGPGSDIFCGAGHGVLQLLWGQIGAILPGELGKKLRPGAFTRATQWRDELPQLARSVAEVAGERTVAGSTHNSGIQTWLWLARALQLCRPEAGNGLGHCSAVLGSEG